MAWIPNVNPNELITSSWGNQIRDRVVNTFTDAAARTAAIPTPVAGMVTYLTASDSLEYWAGAAWLRVGPGQLAYKFSGATQSGIAQTAVDLTGLSATVTVAAGRRIQLTANVGFQKAAPDSNAWATVQVTDGANGLLMDRNVWVPAPSYTTLHMALRIEPGGGSSTWKLRASTAAGFVNALATSLLMVDDVGPASMPD